MIDIILCGAAGRMGREIINFLECVEDIKIIAGVEARGNKFVGGKISGVEITDDILGVVNNARCVVEFTNHTATVAHLKKIKKYKKPCVIGTTGFSKSELEEIKDLSQKFPIFLAPNMSVGVNHLYNLVKSSVKSLPDYEIEVIEAHHHNKVDAPSGTAREIGNIIKKIRPATKFIYGREGHIGERRPEEVAISAVRGGDIVGEHRILFFGDGEFIELRHFATSRRCFASGAIKAVRFILDKPPGQYTISNLL
jgi:4-hydroxy-tetrahydrodipicolinate reductase